MFLFEKKDRLVDTHFFKGTVICHSSLLRDSMGIVDSTLELLRYLELLGVGEVICTPTVTGESDIKVAISAFEHLQERYKGGVKLSLSFKYSLDSDIVVNLGGELKSIGDNKILLVSQFEKRPPRLHSKIYDALSVGKYDSVVLAYPERYKYVNTFSYFYRLSSYYRYKFQLDLLSLSGYNGHRAKRNASYLLDNDMYDSITLDVVDVDTLRSHISKIKLTQKQMDSLKI
ncbi:MAG: CpsB/CapC family capsule biosynthesis tyrosine phosphatase [Rikenellaceae bacterium]